VGSRSVLGIEVRGKIFFLCRGSNPVVQSLFRSYIDWATPISIITIQFFILCAAATAKRPIADTAQQI
jgi:hypothetical protein